MLHSKRFLAPRKGCATLLFILIAMAGCAEPDSVAQESTGPGNQITNPNPPTQSWQMLKDISDQGFLVIHEANELNFTAYAPWSQPGPKADLLLRFFDAQGGVHERQTSVAFDNAKATIEIVVPDEPRPMILLTDCTCRLHPIRLDGDESIELGHAEFISNASEALQVHYEASIEDATGKQPLTHQVQLMGNVTTKYSFGAWGGNLRGEAYLTSPDRELFHVYAEGRDVRADSMNPVAKYPLDGRAWNLTLKGHGWFEITLNSIWLEDEVWAHYGLLPPNTA